MFLSKQIFNEAKGWLNTPFAHQGRLKNVGVDCIGLVVEVARALQINSRQGGMLSCYDFTNYPREPDGVKLQEMLDKHLVRAKKSELREQNVKIYKSGYCSLNPYTYIGLFKIRNQPQHVGIIHRLGMRDGRNISSATESYSLPPVAYLIHAYQPAGKVVMHNFDEKWQKRLLNIYSLKNEVFLSK